MNISEAPRAADASPARKLPLPTNLSTLAPFLGSLELTLTLRQITDERIAVSVLPKPLIADQVKEQIAPVVLDSFRLRTRSALLWVLGGTAGPHPSSFRGASRLGSLPEEGRGREPTRPPAKRGAAETASTAPIPTSSGAKSYDRPTSTARRSRKERRRWCLLRPTRKHKRADRVARGQQNPRPGQLVWFAPGASGHPGG